MRVDGFSKIIASVLPASGALTRAARPPAFMVRLSSMMCGQPARNSSRSRKWRAVAGHDAASSAWPHALRKPRQARSRRAEASTMSRSLMMSGGSRRTTLSPAPMVSSFSLRNLHHSDDGTMRGHHQAFAAHLGDHRGMAVLEPASRCLSARRFVLAPCRGSRRPESRRAPPCRGHGQRIAAEGRAVGAGVMPAAASAVARHAPIGKPPPIPLAIAMMSGVTPVVLIGEELAGAADAALHLVEHQQQAVRVAQLAQAPQECRAAPAACRPRPDRFDQDAGGFRPDRRRRRIEIVERAPGRSRRTGGAEAVEIFLAVRWRRSRASVRPWKAPSKVMSR